MFGWIKGIVLWFLGLTIALLCVTWIGLSTPQRSVWKQHVLLLIDTGDSVPLQATLKRDAGDCARRLTRKWVLWVLRDVPDELPNQEPPSKEPLTQ